MVNKYEHIVWTHSSRRETVSRRHERLKVLRVDSQVSVAVDWSVVEQVASAVCPHHHVSAHFRAFRTDDLATSQSTLTTHTSSKDLICPQSRWRSRSRSASRILLCGTDRVLSVDLDLKFQASCGHEPYTCKGQGQRSLGSKHDGQTGRQTDGQTNAADCITFLKIFIHQNKYSW